MFMAKVNKIKYAGGNGIFNGCLLYTSDAADD